MKLFEYFKYVDQLLLENRMEYILNTQGEKIEQAYNKIRNKQKLVAILSNLSMKEFFEITKYKKNIAKNFITALSNILKKDNLNKYLQWLVNQFIKGNWKTSEDFHDVLDILRIFEKHKKFLQKKDINQYKDIKELKQEIDYLSGADTRSNKQKERDFKERLFKNKEIELFYEDSTLRIFIPKTEIASCFLGRGTKWCTSGYFNNSFKEYSDDGTLYVIIPKNEKSKKYQLFFEADDYELKNEKNVDVSTKAIKKYIKSLSKAFENEPNFFKFISIKYVREKILENLLFEHFIKMNPTKFSVGVGDFSTILEDALNDLISDDELKRIASKYHGYKINEVMKSDYELFLFDDNTLFMLMDTNEVKDIISTKPEYIRFEDLFEIFDNLMTKVEKNNKQNLKKVLQEFEK